jgi:hypothetical protein
LRKLFGTFFSFQYPFFFASSGPIASILSFHISGQRLAPMVFGTPFCVPLMLRPSHEFSPHFPSRETPSDIRERGFLEETEKPKKTKKEIQ